MWANEAGQTVVGDGAEEEGLERVTFHMCPAFERLPVGPGWVRRGLRAAFSGIGVMGGWLAAWNLLTIGTADWRHWLFGGAIALYAILHFW